MYGQLPSAIALLEDLNLEAARDPRFAPSPGSTLRCVAFASPPVGNGACAEYVRARGWTRVFTNVCAPEDTVPRLLFATRTAAAAAAAAAAAGASPPPALEVGPDAPRSPPRGVSGGVRGDDANPLRRLSRLVPLTRQRTRPPAPAAFEEDASTSADASSSSPPPPPPPRGRAAAIAAAARAAGRAMRPEYVHLGPTHWLSKGGYARVSGDDGGDDGGGGGGTSSDPAAYDDADGRLAKMRQSLLQHTMRMYRARTLDLCARVGVLDRSADDDDDDDDATRDSMTTTPSPPLPDASAIAPGPRPLAAVAIVTPAAVKHAAAGLAVAIDGLDLNLTIATATGGGVSAEAKGWPCVCVVDAAASTDRRLFARARAPVFNGRTLPATADVGGGSVRGWTPLTIACEGDFGDAKVVARVARRRVRVVAGGDEMKRGARSFDAARSLAGALAALEGHGGGGGVREVEETEDGVVHDGGWVSYVAARGGGGGGGDGDDNAPRAGVLTSLRDALRRALEWATSRAARGGARRRPPRATRSGSTPGVVTVRVYSLLAPPDDDDDDDEAADGEEPVAHARAFVHRGAAPSSADWWRAVGVIARARKDHGARAMMIPASALGMEAAAADDDARHAGGESPAPAPPPPLPPPPPPSGIGATLFAARDVAAARAVVIDALLATEPEALRAALDAQSARVRATPQPVDRRRRSSRF